MMNQGWECPKCHRCYAPMMMQCSWCNSVTQTTTNSGNLQAFPTNDPRSSQYVPMRFDLNTSNALQEAGVNQAGWGLQSDSGLNKGYNR